MRLYEIEDELLSVDVLMDEWAAEHDGDITDFPLNEELKLLGEERDKKLLNVAAWIKSLLAEATMYKNEIASLQKKKKVVENKAERLKLLLTFNIEEGEKLKDSRSDIGWRKSSQLILDVPVEELPAEYKRTKVEADKTSLKELVKSNPKCDFAHMETNLNLQIR